MTPCDGKCQNLQKTLRYVCASSHSFRDINILNCCPSKGRSRSRNTIFAKTSYDGKCQNLQKTLNIFALAFTVSEILKFKMFDLQKVGQGYVVQFSHCWPSMANIKIYKNHPMYFLVLDLTVADIHLIFWTL